MTPNRATTLHDYHERLNRILLHLDRHIGPYATVGAAWGKPFLSIAQSGTRT